MITHKAKASKSANTKIMQLAKCQAIEHIYRRVVERDKCASLYVCAPAAIEIHFLA